jgi:hypothetical protein
MPFAKEPQAHLILAGASISPGAWMSQSAPESVWNLDIPSAKPLEARENPAVHPTVLTQDMSSRS